MGRRREPADQAKLEVELALHMQEGTPRYRRALRFADQLMGTLRDFLPSHPEMLRFINRDLMLLGFEHNAEVVNVPAEWDALDKAQIEAAMLRAKIDGTIKIITPEEKSDGR